MKRYLSVVAFILFAGTLLAHAQNLDAVLNAMDKAAADFHTAQTDFVWDNYTKVVEEHELQKGTMYFRRQGPDVQMAADINVPDKKYVLFTGGVVSIYLPKAGQVTEYIENVGVRPDIPVDYMTVDNLTNRGKAFVDAFTAAILNLLQ